MISLKEQKGLTKVALKYIELLFNKDEEIFIDSNDDYIKCSFISSLILADQEVECRCLELVLVYQHL